MATAAGECVVTATQSGNVEWSFETASLKMEIPKAPATIKVHDEQIQTDGLPKSLTVRTVPAGLAVTTTYNGSTSRPSAPGTYLVVVKLADPNYSARPVQAYLTISSDGAALPSTVALAGGRPGPAYPVNSYGFVVCLTLALALVLVLAARSSLRKTA